MTRVSDESLDKFIEVSEKEGHKYETREDARQSANNLVGFFDVLIQIDQEEKARVRKLEDHPKGYAIPAKGHTCPLCGHCLFDVDMWYDKWGMKCMNCQNALNKKVVPGYVFRDYKHEKSVSDSTLSWKADLHIQTIRKLVRQGKLKARIVPNGPYVFLRKENPNLMDVIDEEKMERAKTKI